MKYTSIILANWLRDSMYVDKTSDYLMLPFLSNITH